MTPRVLCTSIALAALLTVYGIAPALDAQEHAPEEAPPPQAAAPPVPAEQGAPAAAEPQQGEAPGQPPAQAPPAPAPAAQPPAPPAGQAAPAEAGEPSERTPVRLSMVYGDVSFWRPGAEDWTKAQINTPLAPGDALYSAPNASLELQIGPYAFARTSGDTQIGLDNQERDFLQLKATSGHLSLDLRRLTGGQTFEVDTPNAAFTIATSGYYRIDVNDETTTFITRRSGRATVVPAGGETMSIAASEEVVVQGTDTPRVESYAAPELDAWDRWNYERTDHLLESVSRRYVSPNVYGVDELDHHGTWRSTQDYGTVWVPSGVPPDWAPYSDGRWAWDPLYGWSWVDYASWGWAPCHYGRWVNFGASWGWAPGPFVAAPVYAPALVAFFGGAGFGVSIGLGVPAVGWVALGWGEPVIPWWGGGGFVGRPWWGGWGGPRVVNNVVINRNTVVNVNNINVYRNMNVKNAMIATREDKFGRGVGERVRVGAIDPHKLEPVRGRLPVQPSAASLAPGTGRAARPPQSVLNRSVVATRAPHDPAPHLREAGLKAPERPATAAPRLVAAPKAHAAYSAPRPAFGPSGGVERAAPPPPPRYGGAPAPSHQTNQPGGRPPPAPNAPAAHAAQPPAPHGNQAAPHEAAAPRQPAPGRAAPPPVPERHAAPSSHTLPGEPANQLYRPQPQRAAPHAKPPAPQDRAPAPHASAPAPPHAAAQHAAPQPHAAPQHAAPAGGGHKNQH